MDFLHSLTSLSAANLSEKIKKQVNYVQAVLQIVNLILTWNKSEEINDVSYPYLYITGKGNSNRVYIVKSNSIISFMFPLGLSQKSDHLGNNNWIINKREVVLDLSIVSKCIEFANSIGQKKNAAKIIDIAKNISLNDGVSNTSFDLLEFLLLVEPCYIRFDNDPNSANKFIHPKKHFDINFSVNGTYKIGVYNSIVVEDFKDIFDKTTNSWYAKRPKVSGIRDSYKEKKHKSKYKRRSRTKNLKQLKQNKRKK